MPRKNMVKTAASTLGLGIALLTAQPSQATEFMTEQELLGTIPGATLTGISNEDLATTWVQTYGEGTRNGTSEGLFGTRPYVSDWRVARGLWCETWTSATGTTGTGCWQIERLDPNTLQPWHGTEKLPNVWRIIPDD